MRQQQELIPSSEASESCLKDTFGAQVTTTCPSICEAGPTGSHSHNLRAAAHGPSVQLRQITFPTQPKPSQEAHSHHAQGVVQWASHSAVKHSAGRTPPTRPSPAPEEAPWMRQLRTLGHHCRKRQSRTTPSSYAGPGGPEQRCCVPRLGRSGLAEGTERSGRGGVRWHARR